MRKLLRARELYMHEGPVLATVQTLHHLRGLNFQPQTPMLRLMRHTLSLNSIALSITMHLKASNEGTSGHLGKPTPTAAPRPLFRLPSRRSPGRAFSSSDPSRRPQPGSYIYIYTYHYTYIDIDIERKRCVCIYLYIYIYISSREFQG